MKIVAIRLPEYIFDTSSNPYFFDEVKPKSVVPIAEKIEKAIRDNFDVDNILIRGVQSGLHSPMAREAFIDAIIKNGNDTYIGSDATIVYGAPFNRGVISKILEGFHVYKPKGEDCPQHPVDVWMIFDQNAYDNIEYMHPRHHVLACDRWKLRNDSYGLLGLVIVN